MTLEQSPNIGADCLTTQVSFTFGTITSPADFITQFNEDLFQVPITSATSSVDISPCWSKLGLNYPANTDTAISSSIASPAWSKVGLTYQANLNNSTAAVQQAFEECLSPPPSSLLYQDIPAPLASLLFDSLLTVAHNKLHALQHKSLNLLTNVAAHTTNFDTLVVELPFIKDIENIPPPISTILPPCSPSPEYIIQSPTPSLHYLSPVAAATVQPPPTIDKAYQVNFALFLHLFADPVCTEAANTHPHLYTVVYKRGEKIWCPQDEYIHCNPLCRELTTLLK